MVLQESLEVPTDGKGLYSITSLVNEFVRSQPIESGLLNLFIQHTSASLVIQENADPTAQADLEEFLERLVPENQEWHQHTLEGPDDTTSHLKSALTNTFLQIPIQKGRLALGTWQGVYLWEHRCHHHRRKLLITIVN